MPPFVPHDVEEQPRSRTQSIASTRQVASSRYYASLRVAVEGDDAAVAEHGEVLGNVGAFYGTGAVEFREHIDQLRHAQLASSESLDDGDARGAGEGSEDFGLAAETDRVDLP